MRRSRRAPGTTGLASEEAAAAFTPLLFDSRLASLVSRLVSESDVDSSSSLPPSLSLPHAILSLFRPTHTAHTHAHGHPEPSVRESIRQKVVKMVFGYQREGRQASGHIHVAERVLSQTRQEASTSAVAPAAKQHYI